MDMMQNDFNNLKERGYDSRYSYYCDHTVLRPYTTTQTVREFCQEAVKYGVAAVCVNPIHVTLVKECLKNTAIKTATVIGFPLGANKTCVKVLEAQEAVQDGADEVDMVINIGALREQNYDLVYSDISQVVNAVKDRAKVKVIIETCYLTDEEKIKACQLCVQAGADFVKTSTGMGTGGATVKDVQLMVKAVDGLALVKASGGIDTRDTALEMLRAGASRLGVSKVPQIVEDDVTLLSASKRNQPPKLDSN